MSDWEDDNANMSDGWNDNDEVDQADEKKANKSSKKSQDDGDGDEDGWGDAGGGDEDEGGWNDSGNNDDFAMNSDEEWEDNVPADDQDDGNFDENDGGNRKGGRNPPIDVQIANAFYEAEDHIRSEPKIALEKFLYVINCVQTAVKQQHINTFAEDGIDTTIIAQKPFTNEDYLAELNDFHSESKTAYFKSYYHSSLIYFHQQQYEKMTDMYRNLLCIVPIVTRNESAEAIDSILNLITNASSNAAISSSGSSDTGSPFSFAFLEQMYALTTSKLEQITDGERILFNFKIKLCKTYIDRGDQQNAISILDELHRMCQSPNGEDDKKNKGSELLEIYALKIRLNVNDMNANPLAMKELYEKTYNLSAAVKDPRSQSIIREYWGQWFGEQGQWQRAYAEFYSAFIHYQEIGARDQAKTCLRYVVMANMLAGGEQNPFDAREAKVYQRDADIAALVGLRTAYEKCDVRAFNSCLDEINRASGTESSANFMSQHLHSIKRDFQCKVIVQLVKPYSRISISSIADQIFVQEKVIESCLLQLIGDGLLQGRIDQTTGVLQLSRAEGSSLNSMYESWLSDLCSATESFHFPLATIR